MHRAKLGDRQHRDNPFRKGGSVVVDDDDDDTDSDAFSESDGAYGGERDDQDAEDRPFISPGSKAPLEVASPPPPPPSLPQSRARWPSWRRLLRGCCCALFALLAVAGGLLGTFRWQQSQEADRLVELPYERLEVRDVSDEDLADLVGAMWVLKRVPGSAGRWKYGPWYKSYDEFVADHWDDVVELRCDASNATVHAGPLFAVYHSLLVAEFEDVVRRVLVYEKRTLWNWLSRGTGAGGDKRNKENKKEQQQPPPGLPFWDWVLDEVDAPRSLPGKFQEPRGSDARGAFSRGISAAYFGSARGPLLDGLFSGWWVSKATSPRRSNSQGLMRGTRATGSAVQRFPNFCREPHVWTTSLSPWGGGGGGGDDPTAETTTTTTRRRTPSELLTCAGAATFDDWSTCSSGIHSQLHRFVGGAIMCNVSSKTNNRSSSSSPTYYLDDGGTVVALTQRSRQRRGRGLQQTPGELQSQQLPQQPQPPPPPQQQQQQQQQQEQQQVVHRRADADGGFDVASIVQYAGGSIVGDFDSIFSSVNDPVFFFVHSYFDEEFIHWVSSSSSPPWNAIAARVGDVLKPCRRDAPIAKHRYAPMLLSETKLEKHFLDFVRRVSIAGRGGGGGG